MNALLSVRDLAVSYGPVRAVRGLSLEVRPGEVIAILGPNGAGKSSSLRAISRLESFAGTVVFDGVDTRRRAPEQLARRGLIHVPEGRRIFPTLTVQENLQVATAARARRAAEFGPDDVYDLFPPLRPLRERAGWALSGGEQQMLAIGRALMARPQLLLLDEPSLGLAPQLVTEIFSIIARLHEQGCTILLVEQNAHRALEIADRGYVIETGNIVLADTGKNLLVSPAVRDAYLGG